MASDIEDRVSELYRLPPADFVSARNDLANEVKKDDPAHAKQLRKLRKPTLAARAVNVVAHDDPDRVAALREAGAAVRQAQEEAVGGGSDVDLREADDDRRRLVAELTQAAVQHAGESHRDKIQGTLEAASIDEEVGDEVAAGRLTKPRRRPSGLGHLASMVSGSTSSRQRRDRSKIKELKRELKKTDAAVDRRQDELRRAEERLANAQQGVEAAQERVRAEEGRRDDLRSRLDAASE